MGMEVVGMEMEAVVETDGSETDAVDVFGTDTATEGRMAST
jgi:hypothetical protein